MTRFKHFITTIIGILIVIFGGITLWVGIITPLWFLGFALVGVILFQVKDPAWLKSLVEKIIGK